MGSKKTDEWQGLVSNEPLCSYNAGDSSTG
jgi:hypothetical protein